MSAASSSTSSMVVPRTSRPGASSRRCACATSGAPPQVYGDIDRVRHLRLPQEYVGARQLPLVVSLIIANIRLHHVMVDGGVALNLISLVAFQKLWIFMFRLSPSRPFSVVGSGSIIPRSTIPLLVTFGTPENYRTKSVLFDVSEVNLPFNTIMGKPTLYQFTDITYYGYLVLKMSSPNGVIKIRGDRTASIFTLEKLQALAVTHEVIAGQGVPDQAPSSSCQCVSSSTAPTEVVH
jgi:hypothetical protein